MKWLADLEAAICLIVIIIATITATARYLIN